ncbi:MAG TPA: general secretion pathway protein GspB [Thermomonas sp.]|nr:general secretion pathway protein GspB [Thermomonas sp.]
MSLILEALRKSEAERRRGSTPDVAMELPPPAAARTQAAPSWLLPVLALGAIVLLAAWWGLGRDHSAAGMAPSAAAPASAPANPAAPAIVRRIQRQAAAQAAAVAPPTSPVAATSQPRPAVAEPAPPPVASLPAPPPPPPPVEARDVADIDTTSIPPVKLSMHMWDAAPGKRFVILDGQRMGEGDRNGELTVVAIERDGVVVERNGQRARVPLP